MAPYILLGFLIAGLMHAFVSSATMSRHLSGTGLRPVVKAALIGVPLPLCSCGVLPTAIAMRRGGASKAASTSFLIATPQSGADSIAATWSLLGPAFAVIRPIAALVTSVFGGVAVGRIEDKSAAEDRHEHEAQLCDGGKRRSFVVRTIEALRYGFVDLVDSIGSWLVVGLLIAAAITVYVPDGFFGGLGSTPLLSMLLVMVVAIPMYVCATGSIPIAMSLMLKGLSPGTALVLLMAGPAANFASFTLISREMGRRTAIIYVASISVGAIAFGLMIDYLLPAEWFALGAMHGGCHAMLDVGLFPTICASVLGALLLWSLIRRIVMKYKISEIENAMKQEFKISGMNCPHCRAAVEKAIAGVNGVDKVEVSLSEGLAMVEGACAPQSVVDAVSAAGFDANPIVNS
ncbi:MAG: SO_0444 family Cu/Zn efflux transporter [Bacteroides sp.]|nr:SO_0444 family Cu/Zn efflux transporter [Bacteroides sp.]MCM1471907.1 SO_0444 family Cu/Zn efflux transporter [Bacteroides sp.]